MYGINLPDTEGGVIAFVVVLVLTGWLVPRRLLQDARKEIAFWREAYLLERQARERQSERADVAVDTAQTTTAVLESVRSKSAVAEGEPDATVAG